jgi:RHS repeat-associated protein
MLNSIGAVDLNGRLLNNSNGRMFSPDPFVPHPGNTQSFNRYSYVNNNPLSFVDPSGYDEQSPNDLEEILVTAEALRTNTGGGINAASIGPDTSAYGKALSSSGLTSTSEIPLVVVTGRRATPEMLASFVSLSPNAFNTREIYGLLGAQFGINPADLRTQLTSTVDSIIVTASRAASGDTNFAAFGYGATRNISIEKTTGQFILAGSLPFTVPLAVDAVGLGPAAVSMGRAAVAIRNHLTARVLARALMKGADAYTGNFVDALEADGIVSEAQINMLKSLDSLSTIEGELAPYSPYFPPY